MNATTVSKDQRNLIRVLSADHDLKTVSELTKIPYGNVRQIISRSRKQAVSQTVTNPVAIVAERIESELQQNEKQTRLSLSRYTARAAKDAESATFREAKTVKDLAGTAAITYQWQGKGDKEQSQVAVNIAILGV